MRRPLDFSEDNLPVQWQYVNRNLKEMGIWQDLEKNVKKTIKGTIETVIWEEYDIALARERYQRKKNTQRGYRSGSYYRGLTTVYGKIDNLEMPKPKGIRVRYKGLKAYQRRQEEFDENVLKAMILGLTTRKQKKFFKSFLGDSVSHTTASKLINKIEDSVNSYRNKHLSDKYKYLYLDAIWVHVKELKINNRPILIALGVKPDGNKEILSFKLAKSESETEWSGLVNDLYRRGLKGQNLRLVISDNCSGLKNAIDYVYPYVQLQLCTTHKLRNILGKIKNKKANRKKLMRQASKIFKSRSKNEALSRYKRFIRNWAITEPAAVRSMKKDIEYYFTYFDFPSEERKKLKSNNPLERINRELRKVSRRFGYFQNRRSLDSFIYLLLKEEGLIIDEQVEGMSEEKTNMPLLEFANNS